MREREIGDGSMIRGNFHWEAFEKKTDRWFKWREESAGEKRDIYNNNYWENGGRYFISYILKNSSWDDHFIRARVTWNHPEDWVIACRMARVEELRGVVNDGQELVRFINFGLVACK